MKPIEERDFNVPAMSLRGGKGAHISKHNPKQHREKLKKFLKNADIEEDDFEDWEE